MLTEAEMLTPPRGDGRPCETSVCVCVDLALAWLSGALGGGVTDYMHVIYRRAHSTLGRVACLQPSQQERKERVGVCVTEPAEQETAATADAAGDVNAG